MFSISEVEAACKEWTNTGNDGKPATKSPTEGQLRDIILKRRAHITKMDRLSNPPKQIEQRAEPRVTPEAAARILEEAGFTAERLGHVASGAALKAARSAPACQICGSREDFNPDTLHCDECGQESRRVAG